MPKREIIKTAAAPSASVYSQAIRYGNLVFVSGQTPDDPVTHAPVKGTIAEQTRLVLTHIKTILEAAGSSMEQVLKVNIYLSDIRHKPEMNEVYKTFFPNNPPARIGMAVKGLDDDLDVEIDVIAAAD